MHDGSVQMSKLLLGENLRHLGRRLLYAHLS